MPLIKETCLIYVMHRMLIRCYFFDTPDIIKENIPIETKVVVSILLIIRNAH